MLDLHAFAGSFSLAFAASAVPTTAPGPVPPGPSWFDTVGFPVLIAIAGLILGAAFTYFVKPRFERENDKRAAERERLRNAAEALARAQERRQRDAMRAEKRWLAAATLLRESLFAGFPEELRNGLIDAIVERLEASTHLTDELLLATRLFVELLLLRSPKSGGSAIPLKGAVLESAFAKLVPDIDGVLNKLYHTPASVEFETCFALTSVQSDAERYLSALADLEKDDGGTVQPGTIANPDRFLTPISIKDGFVAPTVLIAGLLQQFETDWPSALSHFNEAVGGTRTKLARLQQFELYCWLLWGPSIPACTCIGWEGTFLALQYGYGDETNSFPLVLDGEVLQRSWKQLTDKLLEAGPEKPLPLAFPSRFSGTLVWGPRYRSDESDYPPVYTVASTATTAARKHGGATIFTGLMLRADSITWPNEQRLYYSGYLWIMFEMCDQEMKPLSPREGERWRRLFPIFEHANFADGDTLLFLKHRLVEKACNAVEQIERESKDTQDGQVRLRYVCATDDPGSVRDDHGEHRFRFMVDPREKDAPPRGDTQHDDGRPDLSGRLPVEKNRLRSIMDDRISHDPRFSDEARTRLFTPPRDALTACDLPEIIIEDFYRNFLHVQNR